MSFPAYPAYKDSTISWLGRVPSHWNVLRLKHACEVFPSNVDKHARDDEPPVRLCNYTDVYYNERITADMPFMEATASEEQIARFTLRGGDTIITKDSETADDIAVAAYVPDDLPGVVCGYHLSMVRPRGSTCGVFVKRLFDSIYAKARFAVAANGLTRVGLGQYAVDNIDLPFPPVDEQRAIAAFLDRETAKIDALVEEQKRLIELLKEKRQAVISQAVTKGLDPSVPMKDSGVAWLGEVPAHWQVGPVKRFWTVIDCKHITAEFVEDGIPLASIREVQGWSVSLSDAKMTTAYFFGQLVEGGRKPSADDIIFSRNATVGEAALVPANAPTFAMGQDVCLFRRIQPNFSGSFMLHQIKSALIKTQLDLVMIGSTFKRVNVEEIRELVVCMPPPGEQTKLAARLSIDIGRLDELISEATLAIELLQERRAALISAAVTGKIDVRGLVPQPEGISA